MTNLRSCVILRSDRRHAWFMERPVIDIPATSKRLKEIRENRGLKISDVQKFFKFEYPQAVYDWENPEKKTLPRIENLVFLAKIYDISMDELIVYER